MANIGPKEIGQNTGYFVGLADLRQTFLYNFGTDTLPQLSTNTYTRSGGASTILSAAGAVLRSEGKKIVSAGRVFRKVQLLVSTGSILNNGSDGIAGSANMNTTDVTPSFITGYIEVPSTTSFTGGGIAAGPIAPVARLG